ncbi:cadmium resistance transporter [Jiangella endophytica]|uniref:cadmium resistance transporter n=1 Tax=Jiangella endophytica TaxID=1623398 RepID=UPI000E354DC7
MFAVTNIDDILILAVFFGQAADHAGAGRRVVVGQYAGFVAILAVAVLGSLGAGLLPVGAVPFLGLLPVALGVRAAWQVWRDRRDGEPGGDGGERTALVVRGPTVGAVAAVTFANGGDNIGVYVPVFTAVGAGGTLVYCGVFLVFVAVWCAAGRFLAARPVIARTLARRGHVVLPVVLIGIGLVILIEGGAFGIPAGH